MFSSVPSSFSAPSIHAACFRSLSLVIFNIFQLLPSDLAESLWQYKASMASSPNNHLEFMISMLPRLPEGTEACILDEKVDILLGF